MFSKLDTDKNGTLNEADFSSVVAAANTRLHQLWSVILQNFDFDGDKQVSQKEFYDGFVLMSYLHQHQQPRKSIPSNLADELDEWVARFNEELRLQTDMLSNFLTH